MPSLRQRPWWHARSARWLAVLALLSLAAGLGLRDPSPPDEPRFVLAAKAMVDTGDWLLPHRGRELYAEKPPVFMWLQAAAYTVVRDWRIAFLLPSLLAALATLWLSADLAARLWGRRAAPWAMGALLCCLQFGLQAKRAQIDMVLVALTTFALWGLCRHLLRGPDWRAAWIGAFAAGVGTVTKGVGFLPLLVLLPWTLLNAPALRRRFAIARAPGDIAPVRAGDGWRWAGVALAFIAGTGVWLLPLGIALLRSHDPALDAYAAELLLKQTGQRYANAWHHVKPAWYYLQVMATLWLPGALLLPWLLPAWWRRLRRGDARLALLLGWSLLVLLFFSASPGKREVYVFPVLPALCIAAAPLLPTLLRRRGVRRLLAAWLLVAGALLLCAGMAGLTGAHGWALHAAVDRGLDATTVDRVLGWLAAIGIAWLAAGAWALRRDGARVALPASLAALWIAHGLGLAPALDASSSARALMQQVEARLPADAALGLVGWREQVLLQARRPVAEFGFKASLDAQWREAAGWARAAPRDAWLLVADDAMDACVDRRAAVAVGRANRRDWFLLQARALGPRCGAALNRSSASDDD